MKKLKVAPRMTQVGGAIELLKLQKIKQAGTTQDNCTPQAIRAIIEILFEPEGIPVEGRSDIDDCDYELYIEALDIARWYFHSSGANQVSIMAAAEAGRKHTAKVFKGAINAALEAA